MRRRRTRIVAVLTCVAFTCVTVAAVAAVAAVPSTDVAVATVRLRTTAKDSSSVLSARLPMRADLLGANWTGDADAIELRVRGADGRWSAWIDLHAGDHGPDADTREWRRASKRRASDPVWVGAAEQVQVRAHDGERARDVQVTAINATGTATRTDRVAARLRSSAAWLLGETAQARPYAGRIHARAEWKAAKAAAAPWYADRVRGVVIHHTAGTNRYSCSQVPALLRGIQRYHMQSNGWNDIGYNFLIDRCGGIWEGRAGGITSPVGGAHSMGLNTGTSGIALLGTHASVRPSPAARAAMQRLVAWRLDIAGVRPDGRALLTAGSGSRFPAGSAVNVRAVSGHRDLFLTECPGALGYAELRTLGRRAWLHGGAKVANVTTSYRLRDPDDAASAVVARVNARAVGSHADQRIDVRFERISTGEVLYESSSTGLVAQASWDAPAGSQVAAWDVRVRVFGVRPNGQRARNQSSLVQAAAADPGLEVVTPPAASSSGELRLQYLLGLDYRLAATLHDPTTGAQLVELLAPTYVGPTSDGVPRELVLQVPSSIPNGAYELRVSLPGDSAAGRSVREFAIDLSR